MAYPALLANLLSLTVWTYCIYLIVSVALTIWVARTLHRNGRLFLVRAFHGDDHLADSVNHLLVVGFYLVNIGWVVSALKYGIDVPNLAGVFETLSTKIGFVLVFLGAMHFLNLYILIGCVIALISKRGPNREAMWRLSCE